MSRILITGGAGFIGSHLSEALLDRGYSVVGVDNLLTGDIANIAHLANRDFLFIKHDITNYIYIDGLPDPRDPEGLAAVLESSDPRWVQLPFAGIESFVEAGVVRPGRTWTCTKGSYSEPVAEHALRF